MAGMLNRREMLASLLAAPLPVAPRARPNLVILLADDLGHRDVGFNGRREWSTPHLDRLASEGTVFDRWYTACPLCAPSRAALLTGRYGIHNGVRDNATDLPSREVTLAEALKPAGYRTALIGKWHQGAEPRTHPLDQGFDDFFGYLSATAAWEHFPKTLFRGRQEVLVNGYSCDLLADEATRFIDAHRDQPFFLYLPFIEPHFWIEAPEENLQKHRGRFPEKDPARPVNAAYAAMIERLDAAIGRVVRKIDEAGLRERTLILFSSDNGATFEQRTYGAPWYHDSNHPFRGQKRSLEEGGIRVPGVVRWPGQVPTGRRADAPVMMIDVMPTMLAAVGVVAPREWDLDGANLLDFWCSRSLAPERTLFWEFTAEGWDMHAAMRGDWKFLQIGSNRWLYNIKLDPQERRSLAPEHPEIFHRLETELAAWKRTARTS